MAPDTIYSSCSSKSCPHFVDQGVALATNLVWRLVFQVNFKNLVTSFYRSAEEKSQVAKK